MRFPTFFLSLGLALSACGPAPDEEPTNECAAAPRTAVSTRFVIDSLAFPRSNRDFNLDFTGDGRPDNQLGNAVFALASLYFNPQPALDRALAEGAVGWFLAVEDAGAGGAPDGRRGVTLSPAKRAPDGRDIIDPDVPGTYLPSRLGATGFDSPSPSDVGCDLTLPFALTIGASQPVPFVLHAAHVQFQERVDPATGARRLDGRIHGAILARDLARSLLPIATAGLQDFAYRNAGSPLVRKLLADVDTGDCQCADGRPAIAGDGHLDACEIAKNDLVRLVLVPDVQLFADADATTYAPNPRNTRKDSFTVGIGFTAVEARVRTP